LKRFIPTEYANGIHDIDVKGLKDKGIKLIMLDIDNTLAPSSKKAPSASTVNWIANAKKMGLEVVLFSNNSKKRVNFFNKQLNLYTIHRALKPLAYNFIKIAKRFDVGIDEICMIGDQIFTDVWGANNAGVMSILVLPLSADEGIDIRFKRFFENRVIKKNKPETYCLIGNPVAHSKSPILHEQVYKFYGIKAKYMLCHAEKENLRQILLQFKKTGVKGFNITVPFKHDIMPYLHEISADAKKIGSVNTVSINDGNWTGYNTDVTGFAMQLKSNNTVIKGSRVKIIGAGGSTAAIVYAVLSEGAASVTVYNRTMDKARQLALKFDGVVAAALDEFNAKDCDILINTTSVGLYPQIDKSPVSDLEGISQSAIVYDIIYNPPETRFMKIAKERGCQAYNGLDMLIFQGLAADEIWFGKKIINDELIQQIREVIGN